MRIWLLCLLVLPVTAAADKVVSGAQQSIATPAYQEPFSTAAMAQLLIGLLLVVGLILGLSWLLRRYSGLTPVSKHMRVLSALHLGSREKAVLVKVGDKQLLLGVAPGRVTCLQQFDEPVVTESELSGGFAEKLSQAMSKTRAGKQND